MLWYGRACYVVVSNSVVEDNGQNTLMQRTGAPQNQNRHIHLWICIIIPRAKSDVAITIVPHTIESKRFYRINEKH